jgi:uncharacterized protein YegP (UPF0339 family)
MFKVELHRDADRWWWRLKNAKNGKVLATSEVYRTRRSAEVIAISVADSLGCDYKDRT